MTRKAQLIFGCLAGVTDSVCIVAAGVFVYFLYKSFTGGEPWPYLSWSVVVALIVWQIGGELKLRKRQADYVHKLMDRGCTRQDAEGAWWICNTGGANLLRDLEQAELVEQNRPLRKEANQE